MELTKNVALTKQEHLSAAVFFFYSCYEKIHFAFQASSIHFCNWAVNFQGIFSSLSSLLPGAGVPISGYKQTNRRADLLSPLRDFFSCSAGSLFHLGREWWGHQSLSCQLITAALVATSPLCLQWDVTVMKNGKKQYAATAEGSIRKEVLNQKSVLETPAVTVSSPARAINSLQCCLLSNATTRAKSK